MNRYYCIRFKRAQTSTQTNLCLAGASQQTKYFYSLAFWSIRVAASFCFFFFYFCDVV